MYGLMVSTMNKSKKITIEVIKEILRQILTTQYSNHHIARVLKVAPNTVKRYRKILRTMSFDWPIYQSMHDDVLLGHFNRQKVPDKNKRQPDWQYIHKMMQSHKHQTLTQLWEEYCFIAPKTAYCQSQFNYYYRQYLKSIDISMRQTHYAGECVYVDYAGKTIGYFDSEAGELKQAQIFVGVLGCSQYTFAFASKSQKLADFIEAHNQMYAFLGGVPQVVVPDNLKSAVTKPGSHPTVNRTYLEQSRHYNCVIEPARVRRPQDKSLAEIGVLIVTRWITVILRRRQFFSVEEINQAIVELLEKLNQRPFKRMDGCRESRFLELDKPVLQPLPAQPFEFATWISTQRVNADYHVIVDKHYYSVPYQYIGRNVEARITHKNIELICANQRIATHTKSDKSGGYTTTNAHRPTNHRAYAEQNLEHYITWAKGVGDAAIALVEGQFLGKPHYAMTGSKACSQLKSLATMYGKERFEAACQCAVDIKSLTVKSVRSILQCKIDQRDEKLPTQNELPLHYNIRGADYYQQGGL